jgi:ABC-type nitrate/sulfonate/bicarbonate transport system substrate-binding protein
MLSTLTRSKMVAAVLVIGLLAVACSGGTTAPSATPTTPASGTAAPGALPKPELTTVRIGLSAPTDLVQFAEKYADVLGYYAEEGITVQVTGFEGDGKALQALVAGQLDLFVGGASTAVNSVITDTPLKIVAMNSYKMTDALYCQSNIKTPADVKGKAVGISTFGGTSHGSALMAIQGIGLTPKDVVITQVGAEGTRVAALKGGSLACGMVAAEQDAAMKALGLNQLIDLTTSTQQWGRSGLMGRVEFLAKNPNTVLNVIAASVRAQNQIYVDKATTATKLSDFTSAKAADATLAVSQFPNYGDRSMTFTQDAFIAPRDILATVQPAMANVDVTKAFDLSFLNTLKSNGFYAKYSIPLN